MTIQDVRAINNPQKSYMWEIEVRALSSGSIEDLKFYAKTVAIPQLAVEQVIINHKSDAARHAGRDASAHTVTVTFWDDENLSIINFFHDWMDNLIHNPNVGGGLTRDLYSADLVIKLKDATDDNVTGQFVLKHCFPIDLAEIPLSYDTSEPVELSVTLSFDGRERS